MIKNMIENVLHRLTEILSTVGGWVCLVLAVVVDYLSGYTAMINVAVLAVVLDAAWGIASSVKQGRFALSELMRNTLSKLTVYGSAVLCFVGVDRLVAAGTGLTTGIVCACIVLVELWSACASMLICYPDMPFLRLIRKALLGEIARKLSIDVKSVESALNKLHEDGKTD
jgi:hypothetical protein